MSIQQIFPSETKKDLACQNQFYISISLFSFKTNFYYLTVHQILRYYNKM